MPLSILAKHCVQVGGSYVPSRIPQSDPESWSPYFASNHKFAVSKEYKSIRIDRVQTPLGIYQSVIRGSAVLIECLITNDMSYFRTDDDFLYISLYHGEQELAVYQLSSALPFIHHPTSDAIYPLPEMLAKVLYLYQHNFSIVSTLKTPALEISGFSHNVSNECHVPSIGFFKKFSDGRIQVQFNDRTLLDFDAEMRMATVLDIHGDRVQVRLANVIAYKRYRFI